jgi:hypothetical protein
MALKKYQYKIFDEELENKYTAFEQIISDKEGFIEAYDMDEAVDQIVDMNGETYEDYDLAYMDENDEYIYIAIKEDGESKRYIYKAYPKQHSEFVWENREMEG